MPRMLSLIYKPVWILFIQLTFCLADSQAPTIRLNDVNAGMLLVEDEYPGNYHEIPKLKTDVKIKIDGMVASATVDQVFTNDGNTPIEAIYVFPLPEEAAVIYAARNTGTNVTLKCISFYRKFLRQTMPKKLPNRC